MEVRACKARGGTSLLAAVPSAQGEGTRSRSPWTEVWEGAIWSIGLGKRPQRRQLLGHCQAPHPKAFTSICQSWHGAGWGSTPPLWGLWGDGPETQGLEVERSPPTSPLPKPGGSKTSLGSRDPRLAGRWEPWASGVVVVGALAGCRHFPPGQARQRGPGMRSVSPSK